MDRAIDADLVAEGLWVGAYPGSPEAVASLVDEMGVTALVSLQTDGDLRGLGLSWDLVWRFLMGRGLKVARVPIEDFDEAALSRGIDDAVAAVHGYRRGGHVTYLHCTAGLNRSPTVAIAYLVEHEGMALEAAWSQVLERRRAMPLRRSLESWTKKRPAGASR